MAVTPEDYGLKTETEVLDGNIVRWVVLKNMNGGSDRIRYEKFTAETAAFYGLKPKG